MAREVLHYPRLDTVIMVEETLQKLNEYPTKTELWKKLPKKVMYQTFNLIISYLEESGKVMMGKNGELIWTWNPELLQKIRSKPHLRVR